MPAASHLTASMLSSAHSRHDLWSQTRVHTLPYGRQDQKKRHSMALGALDLIEEDATPSLFWYRHKSSAGHGHGRGERGEPGYGSSEQDG